MWRTRPISSIVIILIALFFSACGSSSSGSTTGYTVFVTSTSHSGNLGGLSGADEICAARATAGGLSGTYTAWLSADASGDTATVDAKDRITDTKYVTTGGQTVVDNLTELLSGTLQNAIDKDESGNTVSGTTNVWTGTNSDGTVIETDNCDAWTNETNSQDSNTGSSSQTTDGLWTDNNDSYNCNATLHIYCFQTSE